MYEHLSWKPHIDCLMRKLRISNGVFKKASPFLNSKTLKILYYSMIQSRLSYCYCIWWERNKTALLRLQRSANKFIRMIYNIKHRSPVNDVLKSNEHRTIEQLANLEIACFMHKYENKIYLLHFAIFFTKTAKCTSIAKNTSSLRQTRSHSNYFPSYCRINITK